MAPRILILTASIGEGHDAPARTLRDQLLREAPAAEVVLLDALPAMGPAARAASMDIPRVVFFRGGWVWDAAYALSARCGPTRRAAQAALARSSSAGVLALVERHRPDVVVSVFPQTTELLGRLRAAGRLRVPLVAGITDLSALWYWATPGADVHLVTHVESVPEVRRIAGADADVRCVHGFTAPQFLEPPDRGAARSALGLPADGRIVLVSGGGWGVGKVAEAVDVCLGVPEIALAVALCGRNEALAGRLRARYAGCARVRAEGFTDRMADWMAAADALVHSTGGLTILEAQMRGCPAISFGWGRGHLREHNRAFRRFGLAEVAGTAPELGAAIRRALQRPAPIPFDFAALPSAASAVLELAA